MPPFEKFTTKAREAIKRAHELAIERGQNHVHTAHLLAALMLQEESMVLSILERLDIDTLVFTDALLEAIETPEGSPVLSPSYQIYLTPDLAHALENSLKIAASLGDSYVSTEHLFIATLDAAGDTNEIIARFKITKEAAFRALTELRESNVVDADVKGKRLRAIAKYTRSLTKLAHENKLDPVIGREREINRIIQILSRRTKNNPIHIGEPC